MGQTMPAITEQLDARTSPLWQALAQRKGKQAVYLLDCLKTGACPDVRLLPRAQRMTVAREAIASVQEHQRGTYTNAVTLYQRMVGACMASGRQVLTRAELMALMLRELHEGSIVKCLRTLVVTHLVVYTRGHGVQWYEPVRLKRDVVLPAPTVFKKLGHNCEPN